MVSLDPARSFEDDTIVFYWANFFNFFAGAALFEVEIVFGYISLTRSKLIRHP